MVMVESVKVECPAEKTLEGRGPVFRENGLKRD